MEKIKWLNVLTPIVGILLLFTLLRPCKGEEVMKCNYSVSVAVLFFSVIAVANLLALWKKEGKVLVPLVSIPSIMTEYAHSVTGIDIHPGATIGKYFFMDHGTGIVIGETTVIGEHVKVYQGVTLGGLSTKGGQKLKGVKRHPTIGDYVTIYSGSSILGGNTVIEDHVVVGGNTFITKSVSRDTRVSVKEQELQFKN